MSGAAERHAPTPSSCIGATRGRRRNLTPRSPEPQTLVDSGPELRGLRRTPLGRSSENLPLASLRKFRLIGSSLHQPLHQRSLKPTANEQQQPHAMDERIGFIYADVIQQSHDPTNLHELALPALAARRSGVRSPSAPLRLSSYPGRPPTAECRGPRQAPLSANPPRGDPKASPIAPTCPGCPQKTFQSLAQIGDAPVPLTFDTYGAIAGCGGEDSLASSKRRIRWDEGPWY